MAIEYYDNSQGKPVELLEETMIIDDETSYFLTTLNDMSRKINLINIAKALCGDEEGKNSEFKFYTTKSINEKFIQVYSEISSVEKISEQYDKIIENLKTDVDTSLTRLQLAIDRIDPKIQEISNKLAKQFEEKFTELSNTDNEIMIRIDDIYEELTNSDKKILDEVNLKFNELTGMVDQSGDLTESLFNILNQTVDDLKSTLDSYYNELKSQDVSILNRVKTLESRADNTTNKFESYYEKEYIDEKLTEIYNKFKVKNISSNTDEQGRANALNNYTESGMYFFAQSANAANMPPNCVNGMLHVINYDNGVIKQIFYRYGTINSTDNQMFIRTFGSGYWSDWSKILTSKDIISGTSVPTALENGQIYIQYFN